MIKVKTPGFALFSGVIQYANTNLYFSFYMIYNNIAVRKSLMSKDNTYISIIHSILYQRGGQNNQRLFPRIFYINEFKTIN